MRKCEGSVEDVCNKVRVGGCYKVRVGVCYKVRWVCATR